MSPPLPICLFLQLLGLACARDMGFTPEVDAQILFIKSQKPVRVPGEMGFMLMDVNTQ